MARKFDNDISAIPTDENTVLNWPTNDLEEFVAADFIFRQQTDKKVAQFELWLNGVKMLTRDWGNGTHMPAPDTGANGAACGWGMFLVGCSGPAADGRELRIAGMHYVAGPDGPGVLWSDND